MINLQPLRIYLATSNLGKIRDFEAAAFDLGVTIEPLPGLKDAVPPIENGASFEENARIKADYYSRMAPGELVAADDSGLVVDVLGGAPGIHSARYAAMAAGRTESNLNSTDEENNQLLISQIEKVLPSMRSAKFVCVVAVARDGTILDTFHGEAFGQVLERPRGRSGFGYDPLFYFPEIGKTFAEISLNEKAEYSHRGKAFRKLLAWRADWDKIQVALP